MKKKTAKEKYKWFVKHPQKWIETFVKIPNKNGKIVSFKFNPMQKDFFYGIDKYNIILKARQGGMSVCICALALYYAITQDNIDCLLLSHTDESTRKVFNKLKIMFKTIPDWLRPKTDRNNRAELAFENGSTISCHTLGKRDVARGSSIKLIHLSEFGFVGDQAQKQLLSLEQSLVPSGKLIIESTANGIGNYYHDVYWKSVNNENAYKAFFFNWIDTSCMFEDDYIEAERIYKNIHSGKTLTYDELNEDELALIKKYGDKITIPMLIWRRNKISSAGEDGFRQEFPENSMEAFLSTGNAVFSNEIIHKNQQRIESQKEKYIPKKKIVDLPILLKDYYNKSFKIYELPRSGDRYVIGADISQGVGKDYHVAVVYHLKTGKEVAIFRNNKLRPDQMADVINALGRYYNKALISVELASGGHATIERLYYTLKYRNMTRYQSYDDFGKGITQIGYSTNSKTKGIVINTLREMFEKGLIQVNSKELLEEMTVFQCIDGKYGAMAGKHDDIIMATAICCETIKSPIFYKM